MGLCQCHFLFGQDVTVFQADVIFLVEEALFLHAGHVQDVQVGHGILQAAGLLVLNAFGFQHVLDAVSYTHLDVYKRQAGRRCYEWIASIRLAAM